MPMQDSYGRILRDAREREGFDLTTMARRLHIRPDILKAIEDADFDRMPASGYTRNMIRAYARTVGLDQKRISDLYLDSAHMYETGRPRAGSDRQGQRGSSRRSTVDLPSTRSSRRISSDGQREGASRSRDISRSVPSRSVPSRNISRSLPDRSSRSHAPSRGYGYVGEPVGGSGRSSLPSSRPRSQGRIYGGAQASRGLPSFAIWIAIAVAAVALIIVLIVLFNSGKQAVEDVPDIPISGLTDTSNPEGTVSADIVDIPPDKAVFKFSVASGKSAWIEIKDSGSKTPLISEVVRGPYEESFDVTGTLTIKTANPSPVTIEVDGVEKKLNKQSGSEYYSYTVDFPSILDEWEADHPSASDAAADSASSSSSSAADSSYSSSSDSSSKAKSSSSSSKRSST